MSLALDSNILSAVFRGEHTASSILNVLANKRRDGLLLHVTAFAEVLAAPGLQRDLVEDFLNDAGIQTVWETEVIVWEKAIDAFATYAERRRKSGGGQPRRILTDFLIGTHATVMTGELLTLDPQHYQQSFAGLKVIEP